MMHCAAKLSSTSGRQALRQRLVDLLGVRDRGLRAGLQAGERAGRGGAAQRLLERQAGVEPGAEIAAERVAGADRVDRRDLQRRDGKLAFAARRRRRRRAPSVTMIVRPVRSTKARMRAARSRPESFSASV